MAVGGFGFPLPPLRVGSSVGVRAGVLVGMGVLVGGGGAGIVAATDTSPSPSISPTLADNQPVAPSSNMTLYHRWLLLFLAIIVAVSPAYM